ncbi:MAG: GntR family transcriptional regulator [Coriobacteriia bacterium]|nr:GntR family transcriptional regulator [Coriobacteriia bacterium]
MGATSTDAERHALLERVAGFLEATGFPRAVARVYAALLLAEGEGLSTHELMDELGVSKASITNAMQFLVGTELVERYRVRGSREAHYRMLKGKWGGILERKFAATGYIRKIIDEAMELAPSPEACERLQELHDVYAFFEVEFESLMQRWNERKKS